MGRACWIKSAKSFFPTVQCVETLEIAHWLPQANNTLTNRQNVVAPLNDGEGWGVVSHQPGLWISGSCRKKCHFSDRRKKKICLSSALSTSSLCLPPPPPFPSGSKIQGEMEKREAEAPASAVFASVARRDLAILPAAYLESPRTHQEKI